MAAKGRLIELDSDRLASLWSSQRSVGSLAVKGAELWRTRRRDDIYVFVAVSTIKLEGHSEEPVALVCGTLACMSDVSIV